MIVMVFIGNGPAVYSLYHGLCMSLGWPRTPAAYRNSMHLLCRRAQLAVTAPRLFTEQVCVNSSLLYWVCFLLQLPSVSP